MNSLILFNSTKAEHKYFTNNQTNSYNSSESSTKEQETNLMLFNKQNYFDSNRIHNNTEFQSSNQFANDLQQQPSVDYSLNSKMLNLTNTTNSDILLNESAAAVAAASSLLTFQPSLHHHYNDYGHDLTVSSTNQQQTENSEYSEPDYKYSISKLPTPVNSAQYNSHSKSSSSSSSPVCALASPNSTTSSSNNGQLNDDKLLLANTTKVNTPNETKTSLIDDSSSSSTASSHSIPLNETNSFNNNIHSYHNKKILN